MDIHRVLVDANTYQWMMPEQDRDDLFLATYNCKSKIKEWGDQNWYSFNPNNKRGNFFTIGIGGAFGFDKKVYNSDLYTLLEMSGEILPILVGNEEMFIINVLECTNSLNETDSTWDYYDDGSRGRILEYSFFKDRISESTLFKIPQTSKGEILCYSGVKYEEDEFMPLYNKLGFTGLQFEKLA